MGILKGLFELAVDVGAGCARMNRGWKGVGSVDYSASEVAESALRQFDRDRKVAIRYMTDREREEYDSLLKRFPGGYKEYKVWLDELLEKDRLRQEKQLEEDPFGAFIESVRSDEDRIRTDAEWDMSVDRQQGIYRPKSSYGL